MSMKSELCGPPSVHTTATTSHSTKEAKNRIGNTKRKRSEEDSGTEKVPAKRQKADLRFTVQSTSVGATSGRKAGDKENPGNQAVSWKRYNGSGDDEAKRVSFKMRKVMQTPVSTEIIDLTVDVPKADVSLLIQRRSPDEPEKTGVVKHQEKTEQHAKQGTSNMTRFELARRHFLKHGTESFNEDGQHEDVVRAFKLVKRLQKQSKESPEQAMRRMLRKSKHHIMKVDCARREQDSTPALVVGKPWIAASRLDKFIHNSKDNVEEDRWSEGDEAATQEVEREPDDPKEKKRKRRVPWLEQCGWDEPSKLEQWSAVQTKMVEEARELKLWKEREEYIEKNPDWEKKEAEVEEEIRRRRREKRASAKKAAEERQKTGAQPRKKSATLNAGPSQPNRKNDKQNEGSDNKETAVEASEPEGEFDLEDWDFDNISSCTERAK